MAASPTDGRRAEFLNTGLRLLAQGGPRALTAVRLAQELGVTTGSFYWHFESVGTFRNDLLRYWTDDFIPALARDALAAAEGPGDVLRALSILVLKRQANRFDDAMRAWAKTNPEAREAVARADRWRGRVLYEMLDPDRKDSKAARERTNLMGTVWRGSEGMSDPKQRLRFMKLASNADTRP
jgi:AcrR family transcriptional regulator